eukprot:Gb_14460 [translate_table: standard]
MDFTKILSLSILVVLMVGHANAQLTSNFYKNSCRNVLDLVRPVVEDAVRKEARMAASILRLHFHDCFVNGCDGSILLDDTSSFTGEKSAGPNQNSARGFEVIDAIKTAVEKSCPGVVSCADILTIAARDSVVLSNGPSWEVKLGRRDSTTASLDDANKNIPGPSSSVNQLISRFRAQGLSARDMVALSGAHTIGQARCVTFRNRIYNETTIDPRYASGIKQNCPAAGGDSNLSPLDDATPTKFDNGYFVNLKVEKGLLHSDQILLSNGSSTASIVDSYIARETTFINDFTQAMIKMAAIKPLTGKNGQIRKNCRTVN